MKICTLAINSKFTHTNLALSYYYKKIKKKYEVKFIDWNINLNIRNLLFEVYTNKFDIIFISSYIWNKEYILKFINDYKKINSKTKIFIGGPEAMGSIEEFLKEGADFIVMGEGDDIIIDIINGALNNLSYYKDNKLIIGEKRILKDLDKIEYDFSLIKKNKIYYYESQRGCPYKCSYCLSGLEEGLRYRSLDLVKKDIMQFIDLKVELVKFVDRTFNVWIDRAIDIIEFIKANDNNITSFHFELSPTLLSDELIYSLSNSRKGLFQVEIGIQNTTDLVNYKVKRFMKFDNYYDKLKKFMKAFSSHTHLDLIAGLPFSDIKNIKKSFDVLMKLKPNMLQLGFLKIIPLTELYFTSNNYGIKYSKYPPYEVLSTNTLSHNDIIELKYIEKALDMIYNSNFKYTMDYIIKSEVSMYEFFLKFARSIDSILIRKFSLEERYFQIYNILKEDIIIELLELDYAMKRRNRKVLFNKRIIRNKNIDLEKLDISSNGDYSFIKLRLDESLKLTEDYNFVIISHENEELKFIKWSDYEKNFCIQ